MFGMFFSVFLSTTGMITSIVIDVRI